jgi:hypothetical protein
MPNLEIVVAPGDSLFYPISKNIIKYIVKEVIIFNNKLDYLIKLEASNYWEAKISSDWPSEFFVIPEAIGKMVYLTPEEAYKNMTKKTSNNG